MVKAESTKHAKLNHNLYKQVPLMLKLLDEQTTWEI
jgi:hypothetical protein